MRGLRYLLLSAVALVSFGLPQPSLADTAWPVKNRLLGKKDDKSTDVSGIACATDRAPRKCLVIDDERQEAQIVIVKEGELIAGDSIRLVGKKDTPWNIDGEGVAFSPGRGGRPDYFYVIGSHGHPRDGRKRLDPVVNASEIKARFDASSVLVRIPLGADGVDADGRLVAPPKAITLVDLRPMIQVEPKLAPLRPYLGKRLEEETRGFTIEGLAAVDGRIYVGLRGPTLDPTGDRAVAFSFDQDAPFVQDSPSNPKPANADLHVWNLGEKRGVRDLAALEHRILILAGPAYEPNRTALAGKRGEYSIYVWDRKADPRLLADLPAFPNGEKPEALLPMKVHGDGSIDVLVLFDGVEEGGPKLFKDLK